MMHHAHTWRQAKEDCSLLHTAYLTPLHVAWIQRIELAVDEQMANRVMLCEEGAAVDLMQRMWRQLAAPDAAIAAASDAAAADQSFIPSAPDHSQTPPLLPPPMQQQRIRASSQVHLIIRGHTRHSHGIQEQIAWQQTPSKPGSQLCPCRQQHRRS